MKKILLFLLFIPSIVLASNITLKYEDVYNKNDAGSFKLYYKDSKGKYVYYDTLYFDKYISNKELNVKDIYGIKIEKISGYELNIDEITLNNKTDNDYKKKLSKTDNDVIEVIDSLELSLKGSGVLKISGRAPIKLKGPNCAFRFPYKTYKINSNYYTITDYKVSKEYLFYHLDKVITGTGHPSAPMDYYVTNDDKYLYVLSEVFLDNTFDHGKDYSKVYVKDGDDIKSYQVNTVESNIYGQWWYTYTNGIGWQHMIYLIKIPLKDISKDKVELRFEYYGTGAATCEDGNNFASFAILGDDNEKLANAKFEISTKYIDEGEEKEIKEEVVSDENGIVDLSEFINKLNYEYVCKDYFSNSFYLCNNTPVIIKQLTTKEGYELSEPIEGVLNNTSAKSLGYDSERGCESFEAIYEIVVSGKRLSTIVNKKNIEEEPEEPQEEKNPNTSDMIITTIILLIILSLIIFVSENKMKKDI